MSETSATAESGAFDLLVTNASALIGGVRGEQYRVVDRTALGVKDRRIAWIGETADARPERAGRVIDAGGKLLLPGLINTHNHLFQNLVKGMGDEMYLLPWVETLILPTVDEMTPDEAYLGSLLGCLEAIRSGTTSLMDFMFGVPDLELHRAVMRGMRDAGIRGFFGRAVRDLNPDSGWRDPWYIPLDEVFDQLRTLAREFPSGLSVPSTLPAPGTMRTMTVGGLMRVKEFALAEGCQITIHMGEHTEERVTSLDRWGVGAFQKGEEIGFLGPEVVAAHCVKLDEIDLDVIARTGTQVSYNPVSNAYLGNGIAPVLEMLEMGIDVSLATDGGACANTEDMIEALKWGVLMPKVAAQDPARLQLARHPAAGDARRRPRPRPAPRPRCARGRPPGGLLPLRPLPPQVRADARPHLERRLHGVAAERRHGGGRRAGRARRGAVPEHRRGGLRARGARALPRAGAARRHLPPHARPPLHAVRLRPRRHPRGRPRRPGRGGRGRAHRAGARRRRRQRVGRAGRRGAGARRGPGRHRARPLVLLDNCTVVTLDAERRVLRDAAIVVQGNSIAAVGKSRDVRPQYPDEPVRDLKGWVVTPGLVDGHVHLPQAILRGCGDEVPLWVWMRERIFILEGAFTAEDARVSMRLAALEMLKAGTTAFLETLILGRHKLDELAEAVLATGMRAVLPRGITDGGGYLDESPLDPGLYEDPDVAIADALEVGKAYRDSERIRIWFGPRSTGGVTEGLMKRARRPRPRGGGRPLPALRDDRARARLDPQEARPQPGRVRRARRDGRPGRRPRPLHARSTPRRSRRCRARARASSTARPARPRWAAA